MEKSDVTEFFLRYFENYGIDRVWVSENTGINISKLSDDYRQPLSASEFLELCTFLHIKPEAIRECIRNRQSE